MQTAKLFQNGRSQAVRLPKNFRFEGVSQVYIAREGERIILTPSLRPSIEQAISALTKFDHFPEREQPQEQQVREGF
jgi:antitoxin VapB